MLRNTIKIIAFFCLLLAVLNGHATHNRSGEITYEWLGSGQYKIIVTTYTKYSGASQQADRCEQTVYISNLSGSFVDSLICKRTNGTNLCSSDPSAMDGEILDPPVGNFKKNVYTGVITLNAGATYIIYMFDPNRNGGIINITSNSEQQPFALADTLRTFNITGLTVNSTPTLLNPPIDEACNGKPFIHNPGAYDVNGDSLSYSLSIIYGSNGGSLIPIPGYIAAQQYSITIDPITGDFYWPNPGQSGLGEYNFGILITEWRKTADGDYVKMGSVLRDLQINVVVCSNNPPVIDPIPDVCIVAGTTLNQTVTAHDQDNDLITLQASGGPFNVSNPAIFTSTPAAGTVNGSFSWTPTCSQVRSQPYLITIKATDTPSGSNVALVDYESFLIKVVPPPPQNLTVNAVGANMQLDWQIPLSCNQTTGNIIVAYLIYRKNSCQSYTPNPCEQGVPESLGYTQIGSVNAIGVSSTNFSYLDNNGGSGLTQGVDYSYMVVALFADGSLSMSSGIVCAKLVRNIPLLCNVSVDTTDVSAGKIFIRWTQPVVKNTVNDGFDTIANPGPYVYKLYEGVGIGSTTYNPVYSSTSTYYSGFNNISDTTFSSNNIDTKTNAYSYKVELYANNTLVGTSQPSSSVRLTTIGLARRVQLNWTYSTSWTNDTTFIYRQNSLNGYDLIGYSLNNAYTDTGLVNGVNYCYKVKTSGHYSDPGIITPLYNWSQKECATPVDTEAPCQPTTSSTGNCETQITQITWANGDPTCSNDIVYYNLYYTPFIDSAYVKIDSFPSNIHSFTTDYASSIAGCYAITAVDTFGNESAIIQQSCVDNCPEYELPNIITINGDSINDFFIPIKNRYVKDIDLKIFNRWGSLMFETTDPAIHWDGTNKASKQACVNGTYYYICDVHIIRYTGIETIKLKGFLQILRQP